MGVESAEYRVGKEDVVREAGAREQTKIQKEEAAQWVATNLWS